MDFLRLSKQSKLNYVIFITAFLLIASNQIFETTPLGASGTIELVKGSAIPQDSNYTLMTSNLPSVTSAVILNESIDSKYIHLELPIRNVGRILCNVTFQSISINVISQIDFFLGRYNERIDVSAGIIPTTYSFEPRMEDVHYSDSWKTSCSINTGDDRIHLCQIVMWAEFEVPVSALVLDWQTTDGQGMFDNEYTRQMDFFYPIIEIRPSDYEYYLEFRPIFQNCTLYLAPQNLTIRPSWYGSGINSFNISIVENITSTCLIHTRAVRLYLSIEPLLPLIRLTVSASSYYGDIAYQLLFQGAEIPEYIFLPIFPTYYIEVATPKLLSSEPSRYSDVVITSSVQSNGTNDLHLHTIMPYVSILSCQITLWDFIQICFAMTLFTLVVVRISLYFYIKKPRASWKDPRLIPILLIGVTAFIPWFSSFRDNFPFDDVPADIQVLAMGVVPLIISWTDSGGFFLVLPSNGLLWAIASLLIFWIPLFYANYSITPPSNNGDNFLACLFLFSPLLLLGFLQEGLQDTYSFSFVSSFIIQSILILVPIVSISCFFLLRITGKYNFGRHKNQLSLDDKMATQLEKKQVLPVIIGSSTASLGTESQKTAIDVGIRKALNLLLAILQYLLFIIPSSIGFLYERTFPTNAYVSKNMYYANPMNSIGVLLQSIIGNPRYVLILVVVVPLYYFFTFDTLVNLRMKSNKMLTTIFFILWVSMPFFLFVTFSIIYYNYFGVEWIVLSLPYYLLTCVTIRKIGRFIKEEISTLSLIAWILIPVIFLVPSSLLLNWIATMQFAELTYRVYVWIPLPIATILLVIITWPLKGWIQRMKQNKEVDLD